MSKKHLSHTVLKEIGFRLLAEGKTIRVKAEGYSMYPSIRPGSVIYIEPIEPYSVLVPGEIIAWKKETGFVVHRFVRVYELENLKYFVTRGDSSLGEDEPVLFEQIAGRVVKVEYPEGKPVPEDNYRNKKPNYSLNRSLVWINLQFRRIKKFLTTDMHGVNTE
jgi:signal peptidase I